MLVGWSLSYLGGDGCVVCSTRIAMEFELPLQNSINKHTTDPENVQGKKKNEKDYFTGLEANTN